MPDLLTIYGAITLVAICISLIVRMASGASAGELLVSRFYEIPTLRAVIISIGLGLWTTTIYSAFITIEQTWLYFDSAPPGGGKVALLAVAACGALFLVSHLFWKTVVHFGDYRPTPDILDADIRPGIDPKEIASIGKEQFPEKLQFGANGCLAARRWLVAGGCLALALAALSFSSWGQQYGVEDLRIRTENLMFGRLPSLPPDATYFLATTLLLSGLLLLLFNRTYTVLRFSTTVVLAFGITISLMAVCVSSAASVETLRWTVLGCVTVWTVRWGHDLHRASGFQRKTVLLRPIRDEIRAAVPFLAELSHSPDCELSEPKPDEIRRRVANGCQNVEESDPLVTPFLARFLSEVRADFQRMNAAMLRFLTVRRGIDLSAGIGTTRWTQKPVVPLWDEQRFPLHPPKGFIDWRDPLTLGSEWDIVSICALWWQLQNELWLLRW